MLLLDTTGEAQLYNVEVPRSSAQVEGEKKQKVENKKVIAQKEGRRRR